MPCYYPAPPWEGEQKHNAERAVQILCDMAKKLTPREMDDDLLWWFLEHRRIDLRQISEPHYSDKPEGTPEQIRELSDEVHALEAELAWRDAP